MDEYIGISFISYISFHQSSLQEDITKISQRYHKTAITKLRGTQKAGTLRKTAGTIILTTHQKQKRMIRIMQNLLMILYS